MAGKPIATVGSMHVCPMCSGLVPHVGGPVSGPGAPNVLINGKPAALMGDMCVCVGPPDMIAQGEPTVLINGTPVATVGSMTAHGGTIVQGDATVLISSATPTKKATMPIKKIPFPKIRFVDRLGAIARQKAADLKEAEENQKQVKKEAEEQDGEPEIYNLQWVKEEKIIRESKVIKKVLLQASVRNANEGQEVTVKVKKRVPQSKGQVTEEEVTSLTGSVKNNSVTVEWEIEDTDQQQTSNT